MIMNAIKSPKTTGTHHCFEIGVKKPMNIGLKNIVLKIE